MEVPAGDAVSIRFVNSAEDYKTAEPFAAEFLHQVFDDEPEETICGHVKPKVELLFAAGSLRPFISFSSAKKLHSTATDVVGKLKEWYPDNVATSDLDAYLNAVEKDATTWTPPGEQIGEFSLPGDSDSNAVYQIYKVEGEDALNASRTYHERAQVFSIFQIDGARLLDIDPRWCIFYLVRRGSFNGERSFSSIGFCTVYPFFNFPDKTRYRISQFLVYPPYQKKGLGSKFYDSLMTHIRALPDLIDITVEDPAEGFQRMRDICDLRTLRANASLASQAAEMNKSSAERVTSELKVSKRQAQRLCEMSALRALPGNDEEKDKAFRVALKQRLFKENEDELDVIKRQSNEEFYAKLQELFEGTCDTYRQALASIA